jgi:hypothetical protein
VGVRVSVGVYIYVSRCGCACVPVVSHGVAWCESMCDSVWVCEYVWTHVFSRGVC